MHQSCAVQLSQGESEIMFPETSSKHTDPMRGNTSDYKLKTECCLFVSSDRSLYPQNSITIQTNFGRSRLLCRKRKLI